MVAVILVIALGCVFGIGAAKGWWSKENDADALNKQVAVESEVTKELSSDDLKESSDDKDKEKETTKKSEKETKKDSESKTSKSEKKETTKSSENKSKDSNSENDTEDASEQTTAENVTTKKNNESERKQTTTTKAAETKKEASEKTTTTKAAETKKEASEKVTTTTEDKETCKCTVVIDCSTILNNKDKLKSSKAAYVGNGKILSKKISFSEGDTVLKVLRKACDANKIQLEYTNDGYVEGINNIYEFDCGSDSGWMFRVNGVFPNYGAGSYKLSDGDTVEWLYTCDLGYDIGGGY